MRSDIQGHRRLRFSSFTGVLALSTGIILIGTASSSAQQRGARYRDWTQAASVDPRGVSKVNTTALEGCPIESPDGHLLFFASDRGGSATGLDIWVAYRRTPNEPWGEPAPLPQPVNSASNDFCPTPLTGGRLLFVSNRPVESTECPGGADIYETRLDPVQGWLPPRNLGCRVNSRGNEVSPSLVETGDRTVLYFSSDRLGNHDIFSATLQPDGTWSPAVRVDELSTSFDDARPNVRSDGLEIIFDSNREAGNPNLWSSVRSSVCDTWSEPVRLSDSVNSDAPETRPSLSWDGTRLYFGSVRGDGQGNSDVYMATRTRRGAEVSQSVAKCDGGGQR
jgi:Tol biopolymer transport system component